MTWMPGCVSITFFFAQEFHLCGSFRYGDLTEDNIIMGTKRRHICGDIFAGARYSCARDILNSIFGIQGETQ